MTFEDICKSVNDGNKDYADYSTADLMEAYEDARPRIEEFKNQLEDRAIQIGRRYATLKGKSLYSSVREVVFDYNEVVIITSYYHCMSCGKETSKISFPMEYMKWTPEKVEEEFKRLEKARQDEANALAEKKKQQELANKVASFNKLKSELEASGVIVNDTGRV